MSAALLSTVAELRRQFAEQTLRTQAPLAAGLPVPCGSPLPDTTQPRPPWPLNVVDQKVVSRRPTFGGDEAIFAMFVFRLDNFGSAAH